jgi:hypothetical protein
VQKLFNLIQTHLSVPAICSWATGILFRKSLSSPVFWRTFLCFPLGFSKFQVLR